MSEKANFFHEQKREVHFWAIYKLTPSPFMGEKGIPRKIFENKK